MRILHRSHRVDQDEATDESRAIGEQAQPLFSQFLAWLAPMQQTFLRDQFNLNEIVPA
jgi:hypothetical protein